MAGQQIVLATGNPGKLAEIRALLEGTDHVVVSQDRFNVPPVAETGASFVENAIIKARHASAHSGHPAIADDSGLEVDCLDGRPGVRSARYAGEGAGDDANIERLLTELGAAGHGRPAARFRCSAVYLRHAADPSPLIADGVWDGWILPSRRGTGGFGYDPVFFVPTHDCSAAQLDARIKNALSHRGRAFRQLMQYLDAMHERQAADAPATSISATGAYI